MNAHGEGADPVGSAAEEGLRLLGALADWVGERGAGLGHGAGPGSDAGEDSSEDSGERAADTGECRWCPVCRTLHAVREASPEIRDHLVAAGTSLLHAFSGLMQAASAASAAAQGTGSGPARPSRDTNVEHIHVDTDPEVEWPEV